MYQSYYMVPWFTLFFYKSFGKYFKMYCVLPTLKSMRIKFFIGTMILLTVYIFLFYVMVQMWLDRKSLPVSISSVVLPHVIVHIDLKGAPPKLTYLESLLPTLKAHGVTGLLMEYEDMFPYEGKLVNISSRNCYGKTELKKFLKTAAKYDFEIIPLVQTFGHMEHVLKLQEFMHLREVLAFPDSLCPSKIESRAMVKHILEQVIDFHNSIAPLKHIHVGCDEVFHVNVCAQCSAKGVNDVNMFADHVTLISGYVRNRSPQTTVLIWDDMLRSMNPSAWGKFSLAEQLEPVYWNYEPNLQVSHVNLLQYHKVLGGIWIASAYKGADGRESIIPDLAKRYHNHFSWLNFIKDYRFGGEKEIYNFRGIILTGWSRYSHLDAPCELLPAAIPSLILNLLLIRKFKTGVACLLVDKGADVFYQYLSEEFHNSLKCRDLRSLKLGDPLNCDFESSQLYGVLENYEALQYQISNKFNGPLFSIEYQASKRFINPNMAVEHTNWCNNTLNELVNIEITMSHYMKRYYESNVIDEYVSFKTYSLKKCLKSLLKTLRGYSHKRVWERNPLNVTV